MTFMGRRGSSGSGTKPRAGVVYRRATIEDIERATHLEATIHRARGEAGTGRDVGLTIPYRSAVIDIQTPDELI